MVRLLPCALLALTAEALLLPRLFGLGLPLALARPLSLAAVLAAVLLLCRPFLQKGGFAAPGIRPLLVVALLLNHGLFAALTGQVPHIQPLFVLTLSWFGSLIFAAMGARRIARYRVED